MSPRGRHRPEFRSGEMTERSMNDLLRDLFLRLEAVERRQWVDIKVATDAAGVVSPASVAAPAWPVKAVSLASAWDETADAYAYVRHGWSYFGGAISITLFSGDVSPSSTYALRLELRG